MPQIVSNACFMTQFFLTIPTGQMFHRNKNQKVNQNDSKFNLYCNQGTLTFEMHSL